MSNNAENAIKSERRIDLTVLGVLHLVVAVALSWALAIKLTPPGKPVENGLEVLTPGIIIVLLRLPFALTGVGLIRRGTKAVRSAIQVDEGLIALVVMASLLAWELAVMVTALTFVVDIILLVVLARR